MCNLTEPCRNYSDTQALYFSFSAFSCEHEPIHVHVEGYGGKVIFDIVDGNLIQRDLYNIKPNDLKRIKRFAQLNLEKIIEEWNNRFGEKED